jgi:hypothetical protein
MLSFAIAFALRGARKLGRGLPEELNAEERYRVANDVVHRLKEHGDPWRVSEDLLPSREGHATQGSWQNMNRLLIVGILIISTMPLAAQGQQPDPAKLKADAQKVVSIISSDQAKSQIYCQITDLGDQLDQEKDEKKAEALVQKMNELGKQLGPEYVAFVEAAQDLDPDSKDGRDIISMFDELDAACPN